MGLVQYDNDVFLNDEVSVVDLCTPSSEVDKLTGVIVAYDVNITVVVVRATVTPGVNKLVEVMPPAESRPVDVDKDPDRAPVTWSVVEDGEAG